MTSVAHTSEQTNDKNIMRFKMSISPSSYMPHLVEQTLITILIDPVTKHVTTAWIYGTDRRENDRHTQLRLNFTNDFANIIF